jgi:hypothetical protein
VATGLAVGAVGHAPLGSHRLRDLLDWVTTAAPW